MSLLMLVLWVFWSLLSTQTSIKLPKMPKAASVTIMYLFLIDQKTLLTSTPKKIYGLLWRGRREKPDPTKQMTRSNLGWSPMPRCVNAGIHATGGPTKHWYFVSWFRVCTLFLQVSSTKSCRWTYANVVVNNQDLQLGQSVPVKVIMVCIKGYLEKLLSRWSFASFWKNSAIEC